MTSVYKINQIEANPQPGTIIAYLGTDVPNGWILCDGQRVERASFPQLGSALGVPDSSLNIVIPNLSGLFLRGIGSYLTYSGPSNVKDIQLDDLKSHNHDFIYRNQTPAGGNATSTILEGAATSVTTASTGSTETRPYCYGVNWIIKTDLNPSVPGQPTIHGFTGIPSTGISVSFSPPNFNSSNITNYAYSVNGGFGWTLRSPASSNSPITIPAGSWTSIRLRAINASGAGLASTTIPLF